MGVLRDSNAGITVSNFNDAVQEAMYNIHTIEEKKQGNINIKNKKAHSPFKITNLISTLPEQSPKQALQT